MNNTTQLNKKPTESEYFYCVLKENNQHLYFKGRCNKKGTFDSLAIIPLENILFVGRVMEDEEEINERKIN